MSASKESPFYRAINECIPNQKTQTFMILCDEGWRESIVCSSMYEDAAEWLVKILQGKPFKVSS